MTVGQRRAPLQPETFDSHDLGQLEAFVSRIYSRTRIGAAGENTRARIARRVLAPDVAFDTLHYSFELGYSAEPPELLIVCDVVSNTIRSDNAGAEDTFGPGDQFLISRPELPYAGVVYAARLRFTLLDPAVLARVAATTTPDQTVPVRLLDHRPISAVAQLRLQHTIAYVRDEVMASVDGPATPLIAATASQYLAASVLYAYSNTAIDTATDGTTATDRRDASPSTLSRGIAYIEANADLDLTLSDIARAAYVTPRALQLAFRRHLDTTPMAYLRRARLGRARDDLRAAAPGDGQTVTAIAGRWGFTSSRFTEQYRAAYGELPSHTLRQ